MTFPWPHHRISTVLEGGTASCLGVFLHGDFEDWCRACRGIVTQTEWEHAQSFVHCADAARHLVGRALVRQVLVQEFGQRFARSEFLYNACGKPAVDGQVPAFNIAHSGRMVWVAFCHDAEIGVDVEEVLIDLAPFTLLAPLHPDERAEIVLLPLDVARRAFYRTWVCKEAFIKALGAGLSCPPDCFSVCTDATSRDWLRELPDKASIACTSADIQAPDGYSASVVVLKTAIRIETLILNA